MPQDITNAGMVVGALGTRTARLERPSGGAVGSLWKGVFTFLSAVYLAMLAVAYSSLWDAWTTGDWSSFWHTASGQLSFLPLVLTLLSRRHVFDDIFRSKRAVLAARRAAVDGDAALAPLAAEQPEPLRAEDVSALPVALDALQRPIATFAWALVLGITCWALAGVLGLMALVLAAVSVHDESARLALGIIAGLTIFCTLLGVLLLRQRRQRSLHVVADDEGVAWRYGWRRRRIAWRDCRSFTTLSYRSQTDGRRYFIYALEAPTAVLLWEQNAQSTPEERAAHAALCRRIASATGLPLRDLTAGIVQLQQQKQEAKDPVETFDHAANGYRVTTTVETNPIITTPVALPPTVPTLPAQRSVPWGCLAWAVLVLPSLLLYSTGWALQRVQPRYYSALIQRIHTQQPLIADPLTTSAYRWYNHHPTQDDPQFYGIANSSYELSGDDPTQYMDSWSGVWMADAAVEVTTRLRRLDGAANAYNAIGVEVRVNEDPYRMVVFEVTNDGWWQLTRLKRIEGDNDASWLSIDEGRSSAIHTGLNAANRLLVVMRGSHFLCFINDTFIGSYQIPSAELGGQVGMYIDDSLEIGAFNDFRVYPLPKDFPLFM
ncbi:MAG TPA: hypothetical protein VFU88_14105 [Ktedonobacterales bacterium]|nr:hypothetical protein [Ktedonobacterales bacterium]